MPDICAASGIVLGIASDATGEPAFGLRVEQVTDEGAEQCANRTCGHPADQRPQCFTLPEHRS